MLVFGNDLQYAGFTMTLALKLRASAPIVVLGATVTMRLAGGTQDAMLTIAKAKGEPQNAN